jgi:CspA family cold shock protein
MKTGTVKWFNETKGYGFINVEGEANDVFVHISQIQKSGLQGLTEGQNVTFELDESRDKPSATNLQVK